MIGKIASLIMLLLFLEQVAVAQDTTSSTPTISPSIQPLTPRYKDTVVMNVTDTSTRKEIGHGRQVFVENLGSVRCYFAIGPVDVTAVVPTVVVKGDMPAPVGRPLLITAYLSNDTTTRKYIAAICPTGQTATFEVTTGSGQ